MKKETRNDVVHFALKKITFEGRKIPVITIKVNDTSFLDLVKEAELPSAKKEGRKSMAGGYSWLDVEEDNPPSKHFMGKPEPIYESDGRTQLLICPGCREPGCWPLFARIIVNKSTVTWSDFEQPHRTKDGKAGHWSYEHFGPFVFDRGQYEAALGAIKLERN